MGRYKCNAVPSPLRKNARQDGFSLIEISLVLVIAGLALGAIISAIGPQLENRRVSDTQKSLQETREALVGWAIINGRLPRPARSAIDGRERILACANETECTGFIPWTELGVSKLDSWGKVIRYSVTPAYATGTIGTATVTTKTVRTRNAGVPEDLDTDVPAVVYSHGKSNFGTTDIGTPIPNAAVPPFNVDEIANNGAAPLTFVQRPFTEAGAAAAVGGEFDDVVVWVNRARLISQMTSAGTIAAP